MLDTVGNLFSVFRSDVTISNAEVRNVVSNQYLFYLSNSNASLISCLFADLSFAEAGGFGNVFEASYLQVLNSQLTNFTSLENGMLSVTDSWLRITSTLITSFNVSLITAQQSSVHLSQVQVQEGHISLENKSVSMLPDGGVLMCVDCSLVMLTEVSVSDVSANNGAVLSASLLVAAEGRVEVSHCRFTRCRGKTLGGVFSTNGYVVDIRNSVFVDNKADSGGVINYQGNFTASLLLNNTFSNNSAVLDGSCVRWVGLRPALINNSFSGNSALYGNPEASTPNHFRLLESISLQPLTQLPIQGVTGQSMQPPLTIGLFDAIDQLVVTDNSTLVTVEFSPIVSASGNAEVLFFQGIAEFYLLFTPFTLQTIDLNFSSDRTDISLLSVPYQFRDCRAGEIRSDTGCHPCPKNSYSFDPADPICYICFQHAECYGRADVRLSPGYWRNSNMTDQIAECLTFHSCLGGLNSECREGYEGVLCGACQENFYQFGMWECRDCADEVPEAGRAVIIAALVLVSVALPPQLILKTEGPLFHLALIFRVLLNYSHMALFLVLLHVKWPFSTLVHHEVLRIIGSAGAVLVYSGCEFAHFDLGSMYFGVVVTAFFPLLLVAASGLIWGLVSLRYHYLSLTPLQLILSNACIALYNFLPTLSLMIITMYQCQEVAGSSWLVADLSQQCWTGDHLLYILSITLPVFVFLLAAGCFSIYCVLKSHKEIAILRNFHSYLTAEYKGTVSYWELLMMLRKFLLLSLSLAYPLLDHFSHLILFACILGLSLHFDIKVMPYRTLWLNLLNLLTHLSLLMIVYTAVEGSEAVLTALSCVGSFLVLGLGSFTFWKGRSEKVNRYEMVAESSFAGLNYAWTRGQVAPNLVQNNGAEGLPPSPVSQVESSDVELQVPS